MHSAGAGCEVETSPSLVLQGSVLTVDLAPCPAVTQRIWGTVALCFFLLCFHLLGGPPNLHAPLSFALITTAWCAFLAVSTDTQAARIPTVRSV